MAVSKDEILEAISNMTVMEIVDLVKMMEDKFGVTAAAPVAVAAAGPAAAAAPVARHHGHRRLRRRNRSVRALHPFDQDRELLATVIRGEFTLTDHNGQPFSLSSLEGKVVLIFFGYTMCPDVCQRHQRQEQDPAEDQHRIGAGLPGGSEFGQPLGQP